MRAIPTCCTHGCARGCDPRLSSRRRISGTPRCGVASPTLDRRCSLRVIRDCGTRTTHASSPPPVESASSRCLAASTTQALTFRRDGFAGTCAATPQLGGHRSRAAGSFFGQIPSKAVRQWSAHPSHGTALSDVPIADIGPQSTLRPRRAPPTKPTCAEELQAAAQKSHSKRDGPNSDLRRERPDGELVDVHVTGCSIAYSPERTKCADLIDKGTDQELLASKTQPIQAVHLSDPHRRSVIPVPNGIHWLYHRNVVTFCAGASARSASGSSRSPLMSRTARAVLPYRR